MESAADIISVFHFKQSDNDEKWGQVYGQVAPCPTHSVPFFALQTQNKHTYLK